MYWFNCDDGMTTKKNSNRKIAEAVVIYLVVTN